MSQSLTECQITHYLFSDGFFLSLKIFASGTNITNFCQTFKTKFKQK